MSNIRIKNKRLKRELEILKGQAVKPELVYDRRGVETLGCRVIYDSRSHGYIPEAVILNNIVRDLADKLKPYIRFNTYHDHITDNFIVEASVDIVARKEQL